MSPGELDSRLLAEGVYRDSAYAVAIPGYRPTDRDYGGGVGGGEFQPVDPAAIPAPKFISVVAYRQVFPNEQLCGQPTAIDSNLYQGGCAKEPGGLVYRHNEIMHGYQVRIGQRYVEVHGTPGVPHELLRQAARSLRPATEADLDGDFEPTADAEAPVTPLGQCDGSLVTAQAAVTPRRR
ncbi:hypothetical protein CS0771_28670 [Catellatospora sp. IY07-71]|uniref:hypothetical protein n=1 Tax=Catellatospora sp. IY07-71 TaxID=2728827 RepID=UPI001BB3EF3F|nr:hypothetical protein [Catellatospora sp. IY07-71]BCJ73323.1 hypothetical protein CS0771_28670 [Catellatospora sp. IY07-71]